MTEKMTKSDEQIAKVNEKIAQLTKPKENAFIKAESGIMAVCAGGY